MNTLHLIATNAFRILFMAAVLFSLVSCEQSFNGRRRLGFDYAKQELENALSNKGEKQILVDTLIRDKETAIQISEPILFKVYGKENILSERPYEINFIDGYWILKGTLPDNMVGGTFLLIIKATDGQVIKLTHGK